MALKKRPAKKFERKSKRHPFLGLMAIESQTRRQRWLKYGCNGFEEKRQTSCPMSFWTEQDVLEYISKNKVEIASVYGSVEFDGCKYCTSGCERTGCTMCAFGAHFDKGESRFERLKRTHPKQYEYCMRGGCYDPNDGLWKPSADGLGMKHVFDTLNDLYGPQFIRY